jgi:hypothetical protein
LELLIFRIYLPHLRVTLDKCAARDVPHKGQKGAHLYEQTSIYSKPNKAERDAKNRNDFRQAVCDEILWAKHQSKYLAKQRRRERDVKARLQIFDVLRGLPTKMDTLLDSATNTSETLNETIGNLGPTVEGAADRIEQATSKVSDMLSSITDAFSSMSCKLFDTDITSRIVSVISILVNISLASPADRLKSFLWNVFTNFGADIYRGFMSMIQTTKPHRLEMSFAIGDIMSLIGGASTAAFSIPVLGSLLALLFQCLLGLPTTSNFANTIKFFGDRCRSLKNIFDFATHYNYVFEGIVEFLAEKVFGIHLVKKELDAYLDGFSIWAKEILSLSDPTVPLAIRLEKSEELVYRVDYLYTKGLQYASDISLRKLDPKLTLYYQKVFKVIEDARKLCDFTGVFGNKPRMEPLVIQLFGESGVGKSGMTWPLSVDLNALFVGDIKEAQNFSNNIYFRNTEQEFWDGYHGQNVVTYDDFGQRADSGANPNEEFMELIRAANIAPYPLHMAELGEKKRTKFNSKVIVITSNVLTHNVSSLTFPDAYRRRVDICAMVVNKPEYVKSGFSSTHNKNVDRLDTSKCDGPVDTNVYEMILYNAESMQPISGADRVNYDQFMDMCCDAALQKQRRSASINHHLSTRIDEERFRMIRARLEACIPAGFQCNAPRLYSNPFAHGPSDFEVDAARRMWEEFESVHFGESDSFIYNEYTYSLCYANVLLYIVYSQMPRGKYYRVVSFGNRHHITRVRHVSARLEVKFDSSKIDLTDPATHTRLDVNFNGQTISCFPTIPSAEEALDSTIPTFAECAIALKCHRDSVVRQIKQLASFKNFLLLSGVVLAGLGIWKLFSKSEKKSRVMNWEASQSGDEVTTRGKKIRVEGLCPCLRGTKRGCDYGCYDVNEDVVDTSRAHLTKSRVVRNEFFWSGPCKPHGVPSGYCPDCDNACVHGNVRDFCYICDPTWQTRFEAVQSGDEATNKGKRIRVEGQVGSEFFWSKPCKPHAIPAGFCPECDNACVHGNVINFCYICDPAWMVKLGCTDKVSPLAASLAAEATSSADSLTRKSKSIKNEATSSADALTRKGKTIKTEATLDTAVLKEPTLANFQAWRDCTAQDLISTRILSNLYRITRVRGDLPCLNGLFVRDTLMMVPKHLELVLETTDSIKIENIYGSEFVIPLSECRLITIADALGNEKDAMLIQFPRQINAHADLVKHFQTMPELSHKSAYVTLATLRHIREEPTLLLLGNTMAKFTSITLDTDQGKRHIRDCIEYNLNTMNGDCGSPVVCNDNSFVRKIAGIHIAASNDGSSAFGQSITQADLTRTIARFKNVIVSDLDTLANLQLASPDHQLTTNVEYTRSGVKSLFGMAANTFYYIGKCAKAVFTPNKSDIRPSVVQCMVTNTITKPAVLFDKKVNIMKKNLEKCGINTPFIPTSEVKRAADEYKVLLMQNPNESLRRVLTYEESISGNTLSSFISGISRSTSPGYPWGFEKAPGKPGKTTWFGCDDYTYDEGVKVRVEEMAKLAKQGIRVPYVWTDTLKDERRSFKKVDNLETRVFSSGPMDYLVLFRMFFLGFMANVMENRVDNEQSIGTNPFSRDWMRTAKKLKKFGAAVFAGDFSKFDGTLNSCIMHAFVDIINEWYDDGPENALLRHTLFLDIFNSLHLCGDQFYGCTHSQPSGNPITTILNSFYNSVSMRIAFYRCMRAAGLSGLEFKDYVSMVSYGDDNVINFAMSIADWFNQNTVSKAYATFGMIYTDENKSGIMQDYKTLAEVGYLKRAFREDGGLWFAPLDLGVCLEMCNWIRDCPNHEAATCENIEAACRELSVHSKSVFDEWAPKLTKAFYTKTGIYPEVKSYSTYLEDRLAEY